MAAAEMQAAALLGGRHCSATNVTTTRLDLYSAFALWTRETAGVWLEPHPFCRVWSVGLSRHSRQPMSLSELKGCPSRRLLSRHACQLQHDRMHLCAKAWSHSHEGWKLPASACDDGAAAVAGSPRPHTAAAAAAIVSFNHPSGPWRASELRRWRPKWLIFSKPSHAPATSLV